MTTSSADARGWFPNSVSKQDIVGRVALLGAVAAGAAIVESALVPGLLIGGAAVLAPRLLPRGLLRGLEDGLRRTARSLVTAPSAPSAHSEAAQASGESVSFDARRAVAKTVTYRAIVTTVDFSVNFFVIGELVTAAGLSGLSLVGGPIAYFAHEAAWHYWGPASARQSNPLEATVHVPIPGGAESEQNERTRLTGVKVSRALAKTVTYEGVTAVSEFSANYLFVRDFAAAAGMTAFSMVVAPLVYFIHEKAWDFYDAQKTGLPRAPTLKLLPAA